MQTGGRGGVPDFVSNKAFYLASQLSSMQLLPAKNNKEKEKYTSWLVKAPKRVRNRNTGCRGRRGRDDCPGMSQKGSIIWSNEGCF